MGLLSIIHTIPYSNTIKTKVETLFSWQCKYFLFVRHFRFNKNVHKYSSWIAPLNHHVTNLKRGFCNLILHVEYKVKCFDGTGILLQAAEKGNEIKSFIVTYLSIPNVTFYALGSSQMESYIIITYMWIPTAKIQLVHSLHIMRNLPPFAHRASIYRHHNPTEAFLSHSALSSLHSLMIVVL
jgi:hypothetical protein